MVSIEAKLRKQLEIKLLTTGGKSYITGAGERGTSKTSLICWKWNPKLKVSDKEFRCCNGDCRKLYP